MLQCCVPSCKNRSDNPFQQRSTDDEGYLKTSFHKFPNDPDVCRLWLDILNIDALSITASSRICLNHFEEKFFIKSGSHIQLSPDAVPQTTVRNEEDKYSLTIVEHVLQLPLDEITNDFLDSFVYKQEDSNSEIKCRTCLKSDESTVFTDFQKEMLLRCVPQIEIRYSDHICGVCSKNLEISYQFIIQCQEVENILQSGDKDNENEEQFWEVDDNFLEETESVSDNSFENHINEEEDECVQNKLISDPLSIQNKVERIKFDLPKINIVKKYSTEQDGPNFEVTPITRNFSLKVHLNNIMTMAVEEDLPFPETRFDLSTSENAKKRIILLGTNINAIVSCDVCFKELRNDTMLKNHQITCAKQIMKCCNKLFFDKKKFSAHKKTHKNYCCPLCKKQLYNEEELMSHHYECIKNLKCCGLTFESKSDYVKHYKQHRSKGEKYLCDICGKSFEHAYNLSTHKQVHTAPVTCSICKKVLKNSSVYRFHLQTAHRRQKGFMCEKCGKVLNSHILLKLHIDRHRENRTKKYKCKFCDQMFYQKTTIRSHIRLKHTYEGWNFKCDECDEVFCRSDYLKRHKVKQHNGNAVITPKRKRDQSEITPCPVCKKLYKTKALMQTHMKIHDYSSRRFKCSSCKLRFITRGNRDRHELLHKSSQIPCRICFVKRFDNEEELKAHEDTHPKKYTCDQCDEKFARKYLLVSHIINDHNF